MALATAPPHIASQSTLTDMKDGKVDPIPDTQAPLIPRIDISDIDQPMLDAGGGDDSDDERANRSEDEDASRLVQNEPRKPRKITQKKKIEQASFSLWLDDNRKRLSKKPENRVIENDQSIGYLVKNWEGQKIINNPRDYQLELFERAKAKNTIAVLDTGKSQMFQASQSSKRAPRLTVLAKDLGRL